MQQRQDTQRTWNIQRRVPFHSVPARQRIFDGCRQRVSQMERPRHVGRGNDHDELFVGRFVHGRGGIARVVPAGLPPILPGGLDRAGVVAVFHGDGRQILLLTFWRCVYKLGLGGGNLGLLFLFIASFGLIPVDLLLWFAFVLGEFLQLAFGQFGLRKRRAFRKICRHGGKLTVSST